MPTIDDLPDDFLNPYNTPLGEEQRKHNAGFAAKYLYTTYGWGLPAISGLLGNAQAESTLNPNVFYAYEDHQITELRKRAYGFVQWNPVYGTYGSTETERRNYHGSGHPTYYQWCIDQGLTSSYANLDQQLTFIAIGEGAAHWTTNLPRMLAATTARQAADIFYKTYEISGASTTPAKRLQNADNWYSYLYQYFAESPDPPTPPTPTKMPKWLLMMLSERKTKGCTTLHFPTNF